MKPGINTSEFWFCLAVIGFAGSAVLFEKSDMATFMDVVKWAFAAYAGSRGLAKMGNGKNGGKP